jgi:RsiW-degrading membrane proteinase PrsW (M82 family)
MTVVNDDTGPILVVVIVALYLLLALAALIAFGLFYAKQEKKNTAACLIVVFVAAGIAIYVLPALIQGSMVFMGIYVADGKNRRRLPWALAGLFFGPAALLPLIYLRPLPSEVERLSIYKS